MTSKYVALLVDEAQVSICGKNHTHEVPSRRESIDNKFTWFQLPANYNLVYRYVLGEVFTSWVLRRTCTTNKLRFFITGRNEVAKVMFLHLSVCPRGGSASVHAGIPSRSRPPGTRPPPPEQTPSPPADGYGCERYASYWNAFLFFFHFAILLNL